MNIELKVSDRKAGIMAHLLLHHLKMYWREDLPTPLISSSNYTVLAKVVEFAEAEGKQYPIAMIADFPYSQNKLTLLSKEGFFSVHHRFDRINAAYVEAAHQQKLKVLAYTVNDREEAEHLKWIDVDGIFTDDSKLYYL